MLKTEKDSKKTTVNKEVKQEEEYKPMESSIDIPSASGGIPITDMSNHNDIKTKMDFDSGLIDDVPDLPMPRGIVDLLMI